MAANEPIYTFTFTFAMLEAALCDWRDKQAAGYPHRTELIDTVVLAMRDFLSDEEILRKHKLLVGSSPMPPRQAPDPAADQPSRDDG